MLQFSRTHTHTHILHSYLISTYNLYLQPIVVIVVGTKHKWHTRTHTVQGFTAHSLVVVDASLHFNVVLSFYARALLWYTQHTCTQKKYPLCIFRLTTQRTFICGSSINFDQILIVYVYIVGGNCVYHQLISALSTGAVHYALCYIVCLCNIYLLLVQITQVLLLFVHLIVD